MHRRKKSLLLTNMGQVLVTSNTLSFVIDLSSRLSLRIANFDNDVVEDYVADHGGSEIALGTGVRCAAIVWTVAVDALEGLPDYAFVVEGVLDHLFGKGNFGEVGTVVTYYWLYVSDF